MGVKMKMNSRYSSLVLTLVLTGAIAVSSCSSDIEESAVPIPSDPIPDPDPETDNENDEETVKDFVYYCQAKDNSPEIAHTVAMLIEAVTYEKGEVLTCRQAFDRLNEYHDSGEKRYWLSLANKGISALEPFTNLYGVKYIDLSGNGISDLSSLKDNGVLSALKLRHNEFTEFPDLSRFTRLNTLDLSYNPIVTAEDVKSKTTADFIDLSDTLISSGEGLRDMHINHLRLSSMDNLKDYSFISSIAGLEILWLSFNDIESIDFLNDASPDIRLMDLRGNKIKDLSPISRLTKLFKINLSINEIEDADALFRLPKLRELHLNNNFIEKINLPSDMKFDKLTEFHISRNKAIPDLSFVKAFKNLRVLRFNSSGVATVPDLSEHKKLVSVSGNDNALTAQGVGNILKAPKLSHLWVAQNKVGELELPADYPELGLVELAIGDGSYMALDFLKKMPKLTKLDAYYVVTDAFPEELGQNLVSLEIELSPKGAETVHRLLELPQLRHLEVSTASKELVNVNLATRRSQIRTFKLRGFNLAGSLFLSFLPNLTELSLTGGTLSNLVAVADLPLKRLDVSFNCISSIMPLITSNGIWQTLEELRLESNQIMDLGSLLPGQLAKLKVLEAGSNGKRKKDCLWPQLNTAR